MDPFFAAADIQLLNEPYPLFEGTTQAYLIEGQPREQAKHQGMLRAELSEKWGDNATDPSRRQGLKEGVDCSAADSRDSPRFDIIHHAATSFDVAPTPCQGLYEALHQAP